MGKEQEVVPNWFKYDGDGELDLDATLAAAPAKLDANCAFFRSVPEWYEVTEPSEIDELLAQVKNATPEEKGEITDAEIAEMTANIQRMRSYMEAYQRPALTNTQKELLRAICYWASVQTMAEIPQEDED